MQLRHTYQQLLTRRHFFGRSATGIGTAALASLLGSASQSSAQSNGALPEVHFPARAKRVIFLFMSGAMMAHPAELFWITLFMWAWAWLS